MLNRPRAGVNRYPGCTAGDAEAGDAHTKCCIHIAAVLRTTEADDARLERTITMHAPAIPQAPIIASASASKPQPAAQPEEPPLPDRSKLSIVVANRGGILPQFPLGQGIVGRSAEAALIDSLVQPWRECASHRVAGAR